MEGIEGLIERLPPCLHWHTDGEIRVVGHRIGLYTVINLHQSGRSPDEIREVLPTLSPCEIRETIGFYHENPAEVGAYVDEYRAELCRQETAYVPSPAVLRMRRLIEEQARSVHKA